MSAGFIDAKGAEHLFEELRDPAYKFDRADWWGLPKAVVVMLARQPHTATSDVTVSDLVGDLQQQILRKRHGGFVDPREELWSVWGTGLHKALETASEAGTAEVSYRWRSERHGLLVGCRADTIASEDGRFTISDWKTTSVYQAKQLPKGGGLGAKHRKWGAQLKLSAAVAHLSGGPTFHTGEIVVFCRDWRPREAQTQKDYPQDKIVVRSIQIDLGEAVALLNQRLDAWVEALAKPDDELPECEDTLAPMADGRPSRCVLYCDMRQFCRQFQYNYPQRSTT